MKKRSIIKALFATVVIASFAVVMPAFAKSIALKRDSLITKSVLKFTDNRPNRPVFESSFKTDFDAFMFKMASAKTASNSEKALANPKNQLVKSLPPVSFDLQKPIDNVKVYPNPVADQLNLSYSLKKEGLVTIKILDVLGNDIYTLLNQRLSAGVQTNKFTIDSKLNTGFYFVRIVSGSDSIVKRISVL